MKLSKHIDNNLLDLAWSLWTELGVAGVKQNHQGTHIWLEELVIFTSALAEIDPRLRNESLDWCSQFHKYISISRLKSLMNDFEPLAKEPFSKYALTLNSISKANWPVFTETWPAKINLSHKSVLRTPLSASLLNIRARSMFGTGARADVVTFFLLHPHIAFSIAQIAEIGYSKRNLAEILDEMHMGHLLDRTMQGNQQRYCLCKKSPLLQLFKPLPAKAPSWHLIFKVVLSLRMCIQRIENYSESSKAVELHTCLNRHEKSLQKIGLIPPSFQNNFSVYLENFNRWILEWTALLAKGKC